MEDKIHKIIERYYTANYDAICQKADEITEKYADIMQGQGRILKRMDEIESMINAHSIGVQNVYEEVRSLKNVINECIVDIEHIKITLQE